MQTKKVSQVTIFSSLFGMFYSFIGALVFILTLNAYSKVIMNSNMDAFQGLGMRFSSLVVDIYHNYTLTGIGITTLLLIVSQIWEIKNAPYCKKSLIWSLISVIFALIMRYFLGSRVLA
ncbi:MAG: hypothetical protein DLD55_02925 [candidate division SR1 bacterium]|nr:MAG: hypothetical protein DLD55_02925 [candidate division SR1 bacterium]